MGIEASLSFAALRGIAKAAASKIAGRAPDPAVTARPLVHIGRGASIATAVGRIGERVSVRTVGGEPIYSVKNHGTAPALNVQARTSRRGEPVSLGDVPPRGMKPISGVQVGDQHRFWLEWTEVDGRVRKIRKIKPMP